MCITNKGKKWELLNSIWILWTFTLVLACVSFFWIGSRTGRRKWIVSGLIYLFVNFGLIYIAIHFKSINVIFNIITVIIFFGWFAAIVHSFVSRKEYLLRREAVLDLKAATRDAYRNEIRNDYFGKNEKPAELSSVQEANAVSSSTPSLSQTTTPKKTDLNNCSEREMSELPGVGAVLAKKAIEIRAQSGGFLSVQDFCAKLNLMPHFTAQIENLVYVSVIVSKSPSTDNAGDNAGRIIDI